MAAGIVSITAKNGAGVSVATKWWSSDGTDTGDLYPIAVLIDPTALTPLDPAATTTVAVASSEYETVAASQTDQMMGPTGAVGDRLDGLLVIPATTSPGAVSIEDGSTNTVVFAGGASSVPTLAPIYIPFGPGGIASVSGGWEITTGSNVSVMAFGNFT